MRWSFFLLTIALVGITLLLLVRSGEEGDLIGIRHPEISPWGDPFYLTVTSTYGYLSFQKQIIYSYSSYSSVAGFPAVAKPPLLIVESGYRDPYAKVRAFSIHYGWILAVECLALFFLVPSVITRAGRHPVAVDDLR